MAEMEASQAEAADALMEPANDPLPLSAVTLPLMQVIKTAQAQHGLRHGDYARYRWGDAYVACSRFPAHSGDHARACCQSVWIFLVVSPSPLQTVLCTTAAAPVQGAQVHPWQGQVPEEGAAGQGRHRRQVEKIYGCTWLKCTLCRAVAEQAVLHLQACLAVGPIRIRRCWDYAEHQLCPESVPLSTLGLLCRHLLIPLISAERAWATAMELKSEMQDQASAGPATHQSLQFG